MNGLFKSRDDEQSYFVLYDKVLSLWPVRHEAVRIGTSFGVTHINAAGDPQAPPLLLFPGFGSNSAMWFANIGALSELCRVYAVDTIGQPGRSVPERALQASNCNQWIEEIMDGLGLDRVSVMGVSLGGWLALNFALQYGDRVAKVVLLDPAASFQRLSGGFFRHSLVPVMIHPTRKGLIKYFRWLTQGNQVNREYGEMMIQGILNTRPQPPIRATVFTDEELGGIKNEILLLVGGKSVIYDPQKTVARAGKLLPNIKTEIIPGASHGLNMEQPVLVNRNITDFLNGRE